MKTIITALFLGVFVVTVPSYATDLNGDGMDDNYNDLYFSPTQEIGDIAVVDTGDMTVATFLNRIGALGYTISTIPMDSTLETLLNFSLVILPVSHANASNYPTFDALAEDYHMYVNSGGGLWIAQPNPSGMPDNTAEITWAPYPLTLHYWYEESDCPPEVIDSTHCITEGLSSTNFSVPFDNALSYASDWQILVVGNTTNRPGVMFSEYGGGKVLVELTGPSPTNLCPVDDAAIQRYLECLASGPVATSEINWGSLKANFR